MIPTIVESQIKDSKSLYPIQRLNKFGYLRVFPLWHSFHLSQHNYFNSGFDETKQENESNQQYAELTNIDLLRAKLRALEITSLV